MVPELRIVNGPLAGQVIVLTGKQFLVGRERDCHLRPDSELVSRHHCVLRRDEFTLRVRDLGSRNGTYVNGQRIQGEVVLGHDDTLFIGDLTLRVSMEMPQIPRPFGAPNPILDTMNFSGGNTEVFEGNTSVAPKDYLDKQQEAEEDAGQAEQDPSARRQS